MVRTLLLRLLAIWLRVVNFGGRLEKALCLAGVVEDDVLEFQ
jgi:hypothetical protein